jgi:O-antigen/teichoic acid export membrane protein
VSLALFFVFALTPAFVLGLHVFFLGLGDVSPVLRDDVERASLVTLGAGAVAAYVAPFRGFVIARGRVTTAANARLWASIVQVIVVVAGVALPPTLMVPAVGLLAGQLLECWITLRAARDLDPALPLGPRWPRARAEVMANLRDGAASLTSNAATTVAGRVGILVLARVAPLADVASYGVALRAVDQSYGIASQSTAALMSKLGDPRTRAAALRHGTLVYAGVVASGMAAIAIVGQPLLVAWVGDVAATHVTAVTAGLLGIASAVLATQEVASVMLLVAGRTAWEAATPKAVGALVNLTIALVAAPRFGIWAVAGGTLVGNVAHVLLAWRGTGRMLGGGALLAVRLLAPVLASAGVAVVVALGLHGFASRGALASLFACLLTTGAGVLVTVTWLRAGRAGAWLPSVAAERESTRPPRGR